MNAWCAWRLAVLALGCSLPLGAAAAGELAELPPVAWRHRLAWSLSSDEVLFGEVAQVLRLEGGLVAVADRQLGQILLIDGGGAVVGVLPVSGEGPGKVTRLAGLCEHPAEHLMLVQAWPGRVEVVRQDGTPVRSLAAGGRGRGEGVVSLLHVASGHGLLVGVLAAVRFLDEERSQNVLRLSRLGPELEPLGDALRREAVTVDRMGVVDETELDFPIQAWCIVDGGGVAVAPERTRYRLERRDLDGGAPRIYTRDLAPLPRPPAEIEQLRAAYSLEVDGRRQEIAFTFFPTAQMIREIVPLGGERVLLVTAYWIRDLPGGATARLDLVDLAAATVAAVEVSVPLHPDRDRLVVLPNRDLVVLVRANETPIAGRREAAADPVVPAIEYWQFQGERP